jgi:hypothetical protein
VGPFGENLRKERERRKLSLEDVSIATKIGTRFLRAIEEEHFDQLPGGIFNKGFIRAYARQVGVDENRAVTEYLELTAPNLSGVTSDKQFPLELPDKKRRTSQTESRRDSIRPAAGRKDFGDRSAEVPWFWFAAAALMIAIGLSSWNFLSSGWFSKRSADTSQAPRTTPDSSPLTFTGSFRSPASRPATTHSAMSAGAFTIRIVARDDCWLSASVDGKPLSNQLMIAPAERSLDGQREITIRAGNIGALDLFFNGKKLPRQGDFGEVKALTFHSDGLHAAPPAVTPQP